MYDPILGRWLEQDPIGLDAGDMDLYRMEGNNPINRTDPSGLAPPGDPPFGWFPVERQPDYGGLGEFPGRNFYKWHIQPKYGDRWDAVKLGCLGLAKTRLKIPDYSPLPATKEGTNFNLFHPEIIENWKVKCFKDYWSASEYANSIKDKETVILAAQFNNFRDVKPNPELGKNEIDPNTVPTEGSGDYATLQYGPGIKEWYWEWMGTGEGGNDFNVKHRRFNPDKEEVGLPSEHKHTAYCVYTLPPK